MKYIKARVLFWFRASDLVMLIKVRSHPVWCRWSKANTTVCLASLHDACITCLNVLSIKHFNRYTDLRSVWLWVQRVMRAKAVFRLVLKNIMSTYIIHCTNSVLFNKISIKFYIKKNIYILYIYIYTHTHTHTHTPTHTHTHWPLY